MKFMGKGVDEVLCPYGVLVRIIEQDLGGSVIDVLLDEEDSRRGPVRLSFMCCLDSCDSVEWPIVLRKSIYSRSLRAVQALESSRRQFVHPFPLPLCAHGICRASPLAPCCWSSRARCSRPAPTGSSGKPSTALLKPSRRQSGSTRVLTG